MGIGVWLGGVLLSFFWGGGRVSGFRFWVSGFRLQDLSLRTQAARVRNEGSISAGNGHLKLSRPRLVPARPKVCTRHVREPFRFPKRGWVSFRAGPVAL